MSIVALYRLSFFTIILFSVTCCVTHNNINLGGTFSPDGLETTNVNNFHHRDGFLFAGTNRGVFKQNLSKDPEWSSIGLDTDSTEVIDIIAWDDQEIMAAIQYEEYHPENKVIYKTNNSGNNWISYNEYFTDKNINNFLRRLTFDINSPDEIFALGGLPIARSTDRGRNWQTVFETWQLAGFGEFLKINPQNPNIIWSGGATNIFSPHLIKSEDGGQTWTRLNKKISTGSNGTCYDAIVAADNSEKVLIALYGIMRSKDGGENWEQVFSQAGIRTFTHSARNPETVYASGRNANSTLFFAASRDFGDSWKIVEWQDSPAGVQINDMVSVMADGQEVLYFATNKGVYSYTFDKD